MGCKGCGDCFVKDGDDLTEHKKFVDLAYQYSKEVLSDDKTDIVILDEINNVLRLDLLRVEEVVDLIELKAEKTELILTGREIPNEIIAQADLVTEMNNRKHPYQERGIISRRGIEY